METGSFGSINSRERLLVVYTSIDSLEVQTTLRLVDTPYNDSFTGVVDLPKKVETHVVTGL